MNRHVRSALLLGASLLGAGCEQSTNPGTSSFVPEIQYVSPESVTLTTRVSGVAWDPEAFFMSLATCGPTCPIPPFISEGMPLYQRSAIRGGSVSALDPTNGATVGDPSSTDGVGIWVLPKVPSRNTAPYFIVSASQGALPTEQIGPPLPAIPPTQYLKTLTLRPIKTVSGSCVSMEAVHVGSTGVLQAVAKQLSSQGKPTVVSDLLDPTQYHSVTVVGMFHAGNAALRAPAAGTGLSATSTTGSGAPVSYPVYHIDWAPPGTPPSNLRSDRGFIVSATDKSPVGFAVVLVPATLPRPAAITYTVTDPVEDAVARRPWVYMPITAPPTPGIVTFLGIQMGYQPPSIPLFQLPPPPGACVPL
ncbi:hypothetical protein [Hyalangium minutum]|uniref:Lipoprotein n=1 Tax=Hyalangium minutum TaxID=394096 RepID=A0A085WKZ5_9BACT|nr:hypothetical protein [Hyalangium minutum]KFE68358.1 hypothetical protein DB31_7595 [Hyalangium minutum]